MTQVCLELDDILDKGDAPKLKDLVTFSQTNDVATVLLGDVAHALTNYLRAHACCTCKQGAKGFFCIHHLSALVVRFSCLTFDDVCNETMRLAGYRFGTPEGCQEGADGLLPLVTELQKRELIKRAEQQRATGVAVAKASLAEKHRPIPEQHLQSSHAAPDLPAASGLPAPPEHGTADVDARLLSPSKGGLSADALQQHAAMLQEGLGAAGVSSSQIAVPCTNTNVADCAGPPCASLHQQAETIHPNQNMSVVRSALTPSKEALAAAVREWQQVLDVVQHPSTTTPARRAVVPFLQTSAEEALGILRREKEHTLRVDQAARPALAPLVGNMAASPNPPEEKHLLHRSERSRVSKRAYERAESSAVSQSAAEHKYQCGGKAEKASSSQLAKKACTDKL